MTIPTKISGFADYSELEHRLFASWKQKLENVYHLYGFMGFCPRPVESIVALQKKGGIAHQIYSVSRLNDGTMTEFALPFDRTVPFAVYVATHRNELTYPFKRYDISHSFRGERPQAGRFRGFIQADIDVIAQNLSPLGELECLLAMAAGLKSLETPPFLIHVNHIDIPKLLMQEMGVPTDKLPDALRIVDKMSKIGIETVTVELQTLAPDLNLSLLPLLTFRGTLAEFLKIAPTSIQAMPSLVQFQELFNVLDRTHFTFNPGMVRGLDYYTGVVCETFLCDYPQYGSIASGGRYNQLIDNLIDQTTNLEGFGLSIGLTRLFDILKKEKKLPSNAAPQADVAVVYREVSLQKSALDAALALRSEGLATDVYLGSAAIGKQITYADKKQIPYVFMLMGETYVIKNLADGTQSSDIPLLEDAVKHIKSLINNK